ncbi:MAG: hypothetical protein GF399_04770 [Candidatus Coatesbacteria bacterium]|nr:hypothetical protein [Candidatus Coatesbacteria bacterium]
MNTTTKHVFSSTSCARAGGLTACDEGTGIEDVQVASPGFVEVYVCDNNNDPVANANVQLYLEGEGLVRTGWTSTNGIKLFQYSREGNYTAFAQKSMKCGSDSGYKGQGGYLELEIQLELN